MAIGAFGRRVFSTSDKRILTFRDFTYTVSPRYTEHEIIAAKSQAEYIGPGLAEVSFSITLRSDMGIHVRKELEAWRKMAVNGNAERLVIGNRRLGKWYLSGYSEAWGILTNRGRIVTASMNITLREYV